MYYRFDLTDAQWEKIQPFFPDRYHHGKAGHPWNDHRPLVNGTLWHLHTGAPWPDTPQRYGPWQTVYDRFNRWRKDGTWAKVRDALLLQLDRDGFIDEWHVDLHKPRWENEIGKRSLTCKDGGYQPIPSRQGGSTDAAF